MKHKPVDEQIRNYKASARCPICRSEQVEEHNKLPYKNRTVVCMECMDCDEEWSEEFYMDDSDV